MLDVCLLELPECAAKLYNPIEKDAEEAGVFE